MAYSDLHGWLTFYKKCGPVPLNNSLDAEMGGCGMLTDSALTSTVAKTADYKNCCYCGRGCVSPPYTAFFGAG